MYIWLTVSILPHEAKNVLQFFLSMLYTILLSGHMTNSKHMTIWNAWPIFVDHNV